MSTVAKPAISEAHKRRQTTKLKTVVPESNDEIERWGSIIHWLELAIKYVSRASSHGIYRWVVPVTCGSCQKRRLANVYVTEPDGGRLTPDCLRYHSYDYALGYTGLCRSCLKRINKPNTTYPDGTVLFHQERTKDGLPVFCGSCKKRGFLKCELSEKLHAKHWDCPSCGQILGKWLHKESGATVYWLKRKEGHRNYVEFDCAKCSGKFYVKDDLPERVEWWGLCPDDRYKHNPQRIKDERKPLPASDKFIDYESRFGEGKPKPGKKRPSLGQYVKVPCPLPGCGRVNTFHFSVTRRDNFTGLCKPGKNGHTRDEIYLFLQGQAQKGNGHGSGGLGGVVLDSTGRKILEVVKEIIAIWRDVQNPLLKRAEMLDLMKQARVAKRLKESDEDGRALSSRLTRYGVAKAFSRGGVWWRPFVEVVVDEYEQGREPVAIVLSILPLLDPAAKVA